MKTWKIEVTISVSDSWVADGFNLEERIARGEIREHIQSILPYATGSEIKVGIVLKKKPEDTVVRNLQEGISECKD